MLKDYFYFSRADRRILVLSAFIIGVTVFLRSECLQHRHSEDVVSDTVIFYTDVSPEAITAQADSIMPVLAVQTDKNTKPQQVPTQVQRKYERYKFEKGTVIDLNTADTVTLKKVPGIGSYYARRITEYRQRLGGYVAVGQLLEINHLPDTLLCWFCIKDSTIRKIPLNTGTFSELLSHPYLNYEQVRVIVNLRDRKDGIKSPAQLSLYEEFTEQDLERLSPYLGFD